MMPDFTLRRPVHLHRPTFGPRDRRLTGELDGLTGHEAQVQGQEGRSDNRRLDQSATTAVRSSGSQTHGQSLRCSLGYRAGWEGITLARVMTGVYQRIARMMTDFEKVKLLAIPRLLPNLIPIRESAPFLIISSAPALLSISLS